MFTRGGKLLFSIFLAKVCLCQPAPGQLSARELFYHEKPDHDQLPTAAQVRSAVKARPKPTAAAQTAAAPATAQAAPEPAARPSSRGNGLVTNVSLTIPPVQNLGLRYNVLLVNTQSAKAEPVDPDRVFQPKECLALEFESNRSGYLYVFEQASSGKWSPMFPTPELPDESNVVKSRTKIRIPANDCFEVSGEPGIDRVFVVLSRNIEDFYDLSESVKGAHAPQSEPARPATTAPVMMASDRLGAEIAKMRAGLRGRDLTLKKIAKPESADEPANSVYIVNTSATTSDRVVAEIHINHH